MQWLVSLMMSFILVGCIQTGGGNTTSDANITYEKCNGIDDDEDGLTDETDRNDPAQGPCGGTYSNGCPIGYYNCYAGTISGCEPSAEGENCQLPLPDAGIPFDGSIPDTGIDASRDASQDTGVDSGTPNGNCIEQAQSKCASMNTCACHIHEMLKCLGYPSGYGTLCESSSQNKHYLCKASCPPTSFNLGSGFDDGCGSWSCCLVGLACQPPAGSCSDDTCSGP